MDRNLCLNKKDRLLYKIIYEAIDAICGIPFIVYHYIEDNDSILVMKEKSFNNEFIRLRK